jgi:hypothetical protein
LRKKVTKGEVSPSFQPLWTQVWSFAKGKTPEAKLRSGFTAPSTGENPRNAPVTVWRLSLCGGCPHAEAVPMRRLSPCGGCPHAEAVPAWRLSPHRGCSHAETVPASRLSLRRSCPCTKAVPMRGPSPCRACSRTVAVPTMSLFPCRGSSCARLFPCRGCARRTLSHPAPISHKCAPFLKHSPRNQCRHLLRNRCNQRTIVKISFISRASRTRRSTDHTSQSLL